MLTFKLSEAITILENTPVVLSALLNRLSDDWIRATEGPDTWSPFDVLGHLVHGEQTDWIPRILIILNDSDNKTFEPYDRFAQFRMSKGKSMSDLLDEFKSLRAKNLELLKGYGITESDLQRTGIHPSLGTVTLQNLLSAWVVHDLGHLTQIERVMAKQYMEEVGPWTKYMTVLKHTPKE